MNARRRPRTFHDHKAPLAAFMLVVLTSMLMMVHIARSEAAQSWLRHNVSTIAAAPLVAQRVISGSLVEREAEPVEPPAVVAAAPLATPQATEKDDEPAETHEVKVDQVRHHGQNGGRHPHHAAANQPDVDPVDEADDEDGDDGIVDAVDHPSGGSGSKGNGLSWGWGHQSSGDDDSDDQGDDQSDDQGDDDSDGYQGHGWGHGSGNGWGHHGSNQGSVLGQVIGAILGGGHGSGHGWGHGNDNPSSGHGWGLGSSNGWDGNGNGWGHGSNHGSNHGSGHSWGHGGGWGHRG